MDVDMVLDILVDMGVYKNLRVKVDLGNLDRCVECIDVVADTT
jgi:hypothetical protein